MPPESAAVPGIQSGRKFAVASTGTAHTARRGVTGSWFDRNFWIAALPSVVIMLLVFGMPLGFSFYLSFQGWSPTRSLLGGGFIGFQNYQLMLTDPAFQHSLILTLGYTLVTVSLELVLGLGVALLLNKDVPFIGFFRTILIMPMMMTPIVAALCWRLLLDPEYGLINYLIGAKIVWVGEPKLALFSVALVNVWQNVPYVAILLLAGLRSLPSDPREAAAIDGANRWQVFWNITLPALRPAIMVALLLRVIFEFRAFDNVYVMTGGGPGGATNLLSIFTYLLTFGQFDFTFGATSSWIMLIVCLLLCLIPMALFRKKEPQ